MPSPSSHLPPHCTAEDHRWLTITVTGAHAVPRRICSTCGILQSGFTCVDCGAPRWFDFAILGYQPCLCSDIWKHPVYGVN
jgi:hypothetical protein